MDDRSRPGDYGYRRRRNIQLRSDRREGYSTGINWSKPEEQDLSEYNKVIEYEETYDQNYEIEGNEYDVGVDIINEKNSLIDIEKLKSKFQSTKMEKLTIYIDSELIDKIKVLKKEKRIRSYSQCINDALVKYLTT